MGEDDGGRTGRQEFADGRLVGRRDTCLHAVEPSGVPGPALGQSIGGAVAGLQPDSLERGQRDPGGRVPCVERCRSRTEMLTMELGARLVTGLGRRTGAGGAYGTKYYTTYRVCRARRRVGGDVEGDREGHEQVTTGTTSFHARRS